MTQGGTEYTHREDGVAEVAVDVAQLLLLDEGGLLLLLHDVVREEGGLGRLRG